MRATRRDAPTGPGARQQVVLRQKNLECGDVEAVTYELPHRFSIHSRWKGYTVPIVQRDGEWTVRRSRS